MNTFPSTNSTPSLAMGSCQARMMLLLAETQYNITSSRVKRCPACRSVLKWVGSAGMTRSSASLQLRPSCPPRMIGLSQLHPALQSRKTSSTGLTLVPQVQPFGVGSYGFLGTTVDRSLRILASACVYRAFPMSTESQRCDLDFYQRLPLKTMLYSHPWCR
jgi:hypothetical protein